MATRAGGRCSIAHPGELRLASPAIWKQVLAPMVDAGLAGIEAHYAEHRPEQVRQFRDLADHFGLIATGGSDFHGGNRPGVRLGHGRGQLHVPYSTVEELKAWLPTTA
jgi:predicted metal-dependent phosphoesterase TrpH